MGIHANKFDDESRFVCLNDITELQKSTDLLDGDVVLLRSNKTFYTIDKSNVDTVINDVTTDTIILKNNLFAHISIEAYDPKYIIENSEKRFVSDTEKATWNDKYRKSEIDEKITVINDSMLSDPSEKIHIILGAYQGKLCFYSKNKDVTIQGLSEAIGYADGNIRSIDGTLSAYVNDRLISVGDASDTLAQAGSIILENSEYINDNDYSIILKGIVRKADSTCTDIIDAGSSTYTLGINEADHILISSLYSNYTSKDTNSDSGLVRIGNALEANGIESFEYLMIFKGQLTSEEMLIELRKSNTLRECLNYDYNDTSIEHSIIESNEIDIPMIKGRYYNILTNTKGKHSYYIGEDGSIDTNNIMSDVSGYIRLDNVDFPCQLNISIEPRYINILSKEVPDSRVCLAFGANDNGRPFLYGDTELTGWKTASVTQYGDSYIVTNPENTCNFISYKDSAGESKIYTGQSYKNYFVANTTQFITVVQKSDGWVELTYNGGATSSMISGMYKISGDRLSVNTEYTFSAEIEVLNTDLSKGRIVSLLAHRDSFISDGSDTVVTKSGEFSVTATTKDSSLGSYGCYVRFDMSTPIGTKILVRPQLTKSNKILPHIPIGYTFPGGAVSFNNTEGYKIYDNSILAKRISTNGINDNFILSGSYDHLRYYRHKLDNVATYYSNLARTAGLGYGTNVKTPLLAIGIRRSLESFSQLITYKGSLTEQELNVELNKDLYFEGAIDIVTQIKNNMKLRAVLGATPQGDIEDGELHKVGTVWYSAKTEVYYKCKVENSDNYVDPDKWSTLGLSETDDAAKIKVVTQTAYNALGTDVLDDDVIYAITEEV